MRHEGLVALLLLVALLAILTALGWIVLWGARAAIERWRAPVRARRARAWARPGAALRAVVVAAYLVGVWGFIVSELAGYGRFSAGEVVVLAVLSPLVLLAGPWMVLAERSHWLALAATYGVFALWQMWRRLAVALEQRAERR